LIINELSITNVFLVLLLYLPIYVCGVIAQQRQALLLLLLLLSLRLAVKYWYKSWWIGFKTAAELISLHETRHLLQMNLDLQAERICRMYVSNTKTRSAEILAHASSVLNFYILFYFFFFDSQKVPWTSYNEAAVVQRISKYELRSWLV